MSKKTLPWIKVFDDHYQSHLSSPFTFSYINYTYEGSNNQSLRIRWGVEEHNKLNILLYIVSHTLALKVYPKQASPSTLTHNNYQYQIAQRTCSYTYTEVNKIARAIEEKSLAKNIAGTAVLDSCLHGMHNGSQVRISKINKGNHILMKQSYWKMDSCEDNIYHFRALK